MLDGEHDKQYVAELQLPQGDVHAVHTWLLFQVPFGQAHIPETIVIEASLQVKQTVAELQAEQGLGQIVQVPLLI